MSEITQELYEKFNQRFPKPMTLGEVAAELDRMNQQEAEEYDTILCNELFSAFCYNYLKYDQKEQKAILQSEDYKIFKRRSANLARHTFYDAWCAFLEGRKKEVKIYIYTSIFKPLSTKHLLMEKLMLLWGCCWHSKMPMPVSGSM